MDDIERAKFKQIDGGIIDSHAHLFKEFYGADRELIIQRMAEFNVRQIINPAVDLKSTPELLDLAQEHSNIFIALGLHPHQAIEWDENTKEILCAHIDNSKVVAVGECGLDFFYNTSPPEKQIYAFKEQLKIARQFDKPVIIHCRDAWEEMLIILSEEGKGMRGVLHCFTGDEKIAAQLQSLPDFDAYISFSGIVTFTKSVAVQSAAKIVDKNKLLVETDCPFLAPQTVRGQRNEPAYVWYVVEKLAQLRNVTLSEIALLCSANARQLFALPILPEVHS